MTKRAKKNPKKELILQHRAFLERNDKKLSIYQKNVIQIEIEKLEKEVKK